MCKKMGAHRLVADPAWTQFVPSVVWNFGQHTFLLFVKKYNSMTTCPTSRCLTIPLLCPLCFAQQCPSATTAWTRLKLRFNLQLCNTTLHAMIRKMHRLSTVSKVNAINSDTSSDCSQTKSEVPLPSCQAWAYAAAAADHPSLILSGFCWEWRWMKQVKRRQGVLNLGNKKTT